MPDQARGEDAVLVAVQRGLAGAQVSRTLRAVEARWIEEDFPPRERVLQLLDEELSNAKPS